MYFSVDSAKNFVYNGGVNKSTSPAIIGIIATFQYNSSPKEQKSRAIFRSAFLRPERAYLRVYAVLDASLSVLIKIVGYDVHEPCSCIL